MMHSTDKGDKMGCIMHNSDSHTVSAIVSLMILSSFYLFIYELRFHKLLVLVHFLAPSSVLFPIIICYPTN